VWDAGTQLEGRTVMVGGARWHVTIIGLHRPGEVRDGDHRVAPVSFSQVTKGTIDPYLLLKVCRARRWVVGWACLLWLNRRLPCAQSLSLVTRLTPPRRRAPTGSEVPAHLRTVSPSPIMLRC
jgi:hypothetical protein